MRVRCVRVYRAMVSLLYEGESEERQMMRSHHPGTLSFTCVCVCVCVRAGGGGDDDDNVHECV